MKIAAKESSETLLLADTVRTKSALIHFDKKLKDNLDEIIRILSKIISSAKGKIPGFVWSIL